MTVVAIALVGALVVGLSIGGRVRHLRNPPLVRTGYLILAFVSQIAVMLAYHPSVMYMWLVIGILSMTWYWLGNRTRRGLLLVIAGLGLNLLVVLLNAGQPISVSAAQRAGLDISVESLESDPRAIPIDDATILPWLGQIVPVPIPHWSTVASPGDILGAGGLAVFLLTGLTGYGRELPQTPEEARKERKDRKAARREGREANDAALEGQIIEAGGGTPDTPSAAAVLAAVTAAREDAEARARTASAATVAGQSAGQAESQGPTDQNNNKNQNKNKNKNQNNKGNNNNGNNKNKDRGGSDGGQGARLSAEEKAERKRARQAKKQAKREAAADAGAGPADDAVDSGGTGAAESPAEVYAAVVAAVGEDAPPTGNVARTEDPTEAVDTAVWHDRAAAHRVAGDD